MYFKRQRGFTLIEALIAISIITLMSMLLLGAAGPWISLKQSMDTSRKLADLRQGFYSYYSDNAFQIESSPSGQFGGLTTSTVETVDGMRLCKSQGAALQANANRFAEGYPGVELDGYKNPFCFFVSDIYSEVINGVELPFRNIAVVSTGADGTLHPDTKLNGLNLVLGGDDQGVSIVGRDIQRKKLEETQKRMAKIAMMYETYFTTRFLSYADRDITRYYFSKEFDASGFVNSTGGNWVAVDPGLSGLGITGSQGYTAWETVGGVSNQIQMNNSKVNDGSTIQPRTPHTTGVGSLPYTVVLRARVPSTSLTTPNYVTHVAVGGY